MKHVVGSERIEGLVRDPVWQAEPGAAEFPEARLGTHPPHVIDFDHRDTSAKSFALSGKCQLKSRADRLHEVAKCDVVCANCHRIRTQLQRTEFVWSWPRRGESPRLAATPESEAGDSNPYCVLGRHACCHYTSLA